MPQDGYQFSSSMQRGLEQERLGQQSKLLDPLTERVWRAAGIEPGMRVLDLGSGTGDTSLLAATIVGPDGAVVGVERNPDVIASAKARIASERLDNVSFLEGDVASLDLKDTFDAAVGRLILAHLADPVGALAQMPRLVRPGGVVCMQEPALPGRLSAPETPLSMLANRVLTEVFARTGRTDDMGGELHADFRAAGLPAPQLLCEIACGGPETPELIDWFRSMFTAMLPAIEREGLASSEELGLDTFVPRFAAELEKVGGIAMLPPLVGAWCRLPLN